MSALSFYYGAFFGWITTMIFLLFVYMINRKDDE